MELTQYRYVGKSNIQNYFIYPLQMANDGWIILTEILNLHSTNKIEHNFAKADLARLKRFHCQMISIENIGQMWQFWYTFLWFDWALCTPKCPTCYQIFILYFHPGWGLRIFSEAQHLRRVIWWYHRPINTKETVVFSSWNLLVRSAWYAFIILHGTNPHQWINMGAGIYCSCSYNK